MVGHVSWEDRPFAEYSRSEIANEIAHPFYPRDIHDPPATNVDAAKQQLQLRDKAKSRIEKKLPDVELRAKKPFNFAAQHTVQRLETELKRIEGGSGAAHRIDSLPSMPTIEATGPFAADQKSFNAAVTKGTELIASAQIDNIVGALAIAQEVVEEFRKACPHQVLTSAATQSAMSLSRAFDQKIKTAARDLYNEASRLREEAADPRPVLDGFRPTLEAQSRQATSALKDLQTLSNQRQTFVEYGVPTEKIDAKIDPLMKNIGANQTKIVPAVHEAVNQAIKREASNYKASIKEMNAEGLKNAEGAVRRLLQAYTGQIK